jgi:sugar lactone lactonase YvrE
MSWQTIVSQPSVLGESPFWSQDEQTLYWVDIAGFAIKRANVFMGTVESWAMPSEPGCMAPAKSGGYVIALRDCIVRARSWGAALELLATFDHDAKTTRFNDGKCDALGRFWAGTMFEPRTARSANLHCLDARAGRKPLVQHMASDAIIANSLCWSPDAKTVYWADTPNHVMYAWDYDLESNRMANKRVFKQFATKPEGWTFGQPDNGGYLGRPDGASVDVQGNLWVAMFEGQRVLQIAPSGDILQSFATPTLCNTMPCFGGDDMQTLYLTTARHNRAEAELIVQPLLGCVLSMRVGVAGLPVNFFED